MKAYGVMGRFAAGRRAALAAMDLCALSLLLGGCATTTTTTPAPRPSHWATPVDAAGIPNLYRVNGSAKLREIEAALGPIAR